MLVDGNGFLSGKMFPGIAQTGEHGEVLRREKFLQMPVLRLLCRSEAGEDQIPDLLRSGAVFGESDDFAFVGTRDERRTFVRVPQLEFGGCSPRPIKERKLSAIMLVGI